MSRRGACEKPSPRIVGRGQVEERGRGVEGVAEIAFAAEGGRTRLAHLYQCSPLRVLFPEAPGEDLRQAVLVTTSGGLVGGDRHRVTVRLGPGSRAHVTAAAAEKVYRSLGPAAEVAHEFAVREGGWLEFLPHETILFDGARLRREARIELAAGAGFLGGGITVFGRRARGERFGRGYLRDLVEVRRGGRLIWGDALLLDGDVAATIADPACFGGAAACAGLVLVPPAADPRSFLEPARAVLAQSPAGVRGGITALDHVLLARWLAADPALLRHAFAELACHLRAAAMGLPPRLPRLWHV